MQQLDGKWSEWWRQSTDMCDSLQQQMGVVCSHQEATSQRLHHLEAQVPPLSCCHSPCPLTLFLMLPSGVALCCPVTLPLVLPYNVACHVASHVAL